MELENLTMQQLDALLECAEALKDVVNAASGGDPYTSIELTAIGNGFVDALSRLSETGVRLNGEC
jgi:hypothetical protein